MQKRYKFNQYGVCTNPKSETIYKSEKMHAIIKLATDGERWAYGYELAIKGTSVGCFSHSGLPKINQYHMGFKTEKEARTAAIEWAIYTFKHQTSMYNVTAVLNALQKALTPQLKLF
jgi:hypothetical protein